MDAAIAVWRRGDRWQARLLGGAIVFFVVAGAGQTVLALWGIIGMPIMISLFFLGIVAAMGFQMSDGVLGALRLSDESARERRADNPGRRSGGIWHLDVEHRAQPGLGLREVAPPVRVRRRGGHHL